MDPDSLRWSPAPAAGILFDSPLKSEPGSDSDDSDIEDTKPQTSNTKTVVTEQRRGPGRPRKSEVKPEADRQEDSELEIKIGGGRRQILSTESESECAVNTGQAGAQRSSKRVSQSGECAGE